jgi:hypothetical protein
MASGEQHGSGKLRLHDPVHFLSRNRNTKDEALSEVPGCVQADRKPEVSSHVSRTNHHSCFDSYRQRVRPGRVGIDEVSEAEHPCRVPQLGRDASGRWGSLPSQTSAKQGCYYQDGAQGRNRTTDTVIFSHVLYQLSYLGPRHGGRCLRGERLP